MPPASLLQWDGYPHLKCWNYLRLHPLHKNPAGAHGFGYAVTQHIRSLKVRHDDAC